jgi:hypothetical protein
VKRAISFILGIIIAAPALSGMAYGWIFIVSGVKFFSEDQLLALWAQLCIGFILNAAWRIRHDL